MRKTLCRWLIPAFLVLASALALAWVWTTREGHRQGNVVPTMVIVAITAILLVAWALTALPKGWKAKLAVLALLFAVGGAVAALVRIGGVTGDVIPILEWRFTRTPEATLGAGPGEAGLPSEAKDLPAGDLSSSAGRLEYPQFLGPGRDGTVPGVQLDRDWTARPPRLLWRKEIGAGWSGFAAAGDGAFTQEQRGDLEMVTCSSLLTGEPIWTHQDKARYQSVLGGIGPRATPTVGARRIYTLGATGILNCLDRRTGRRFWARNILEDNGASMSEWGMSGSPLLQGGLVIVPAGGKNDRSLVAYRMDSGEPAWHGGNDRAGYSSPLYTVLAGTPQILILNSGSVASHDPATGRVLWQVPWSRSNPNVAQPLPVPGDRVLVSSGYGVGCALFKVRKGPGGGLEVEQAWKTPSLKAKFANFVRREGFVYGLDDGILVCLDIETGGRRWKAGRYGHGQMLLAGDLLLLTTEAGEIVLVEAVPEGHKEIARFQALDGKTWNSPALAAPYLLVRNDRMAACYELPLAEPVRR